MLVWLFILLLPVLPMNTATPAVITTIVYDVAPWQVAWGYPLPDISQRNIYVKHATWPGWARMSPMATQTSDQVAVQPHTDGRLYVAWTFQETPTSPGKPYYGSVAAASSMTIESGWVANWSADLRQPWLYHDATNALLLAAKKMGTNTRYRWYWNGKVWEDDNAFQEKRVYLPLLSR